MPHPPVEIGEPIVSRDEMREGLPEFARLYRHRPIRDNSGGMMIPHMYVLWLILRKVRPSVVIESGVFRGQSTWLIEQACPEAAVICFEPRIDNIVYTSSRATYVRGDFLAYGKDLSASRAFAFFDDHQDALPRIKHCKWIGIKEMMFDDNYPPGKGDCYSIKKIIFGSGFEPKRRISSFQRNDLFTRVLRKAFRLAHYDPFAPIGDLPIEPNTDDWMLLKKNLDCYMEFPPIVKAEKTRWGEDWGDFPYATPEPILSATDHGQELSAYWEEAYAYTWPCYARLK
jgi:hypothetical protein